mmetsp:Transcript_88344/g.253056  ORF Transcript_88344/g.253056 Transcript_88344/m.253056 type:complete len:228 (-) Transcript_88344:55-738(-)
MPSPRRPRSTPTSSACAASCARRRRCGGSGGTSPAPRSRRRMPGLSFLRLGPPPRPCRRRQSSSAASSARAWCRAPSTRASAAFCPHSCPLPSPSSTSTLRMAQDSSFTGSAAWRYAPHRSSLPRRCWWRCSPSPSSPPSPLQAGADTGSPTETRWPRSRSSWKGLRTSARRASRTSFSPQSAATRSWPRNSCVAPPLGRRIRSIWSFAIPWPRLFAPRCAAQRLAR